MQIDDLSYDRYRLADLCRRMQIVRLEVFGSFSKGVATPESDLDVLVTFAPGAVVGLPFFGLPDDLSDIFLRPVDVLTRRTVEADTNPLFREAVLSSTTVIFDAAAS